MAHQKPWNEYETALLIKAYINVKEYGKNLDEELSKLSMTLRSIAIANGEKIDETYRNLNGMHWQYGFIKLAFEKATYESRRPTELFLRMVELYKTDREKFNNILQMKYQHERTDRLQKMEDNDIKVKFQQWLLGNDIKKHSVTECTECIMMFQNFKYQVLIKRNCEIENLIIFRI